MSENDGSVSTLLTHSSFCALKQKSIIFFKIGNSLSWGILVEKPNEDIFSPLLRLFKLSKEYRIGSLF